MNKLSVIIPVFNEKDTVVELVNRTLLVPLNKEIIIVDDGSSDGTRELLSRHFQSNPTVKIVLHTKNKGKGRAIRAGISHISGDIAIVQDADLEYDPQDFVPIVKMFDSPDVHVVYGTRFPVTGRTKFIIQWIQNKFFGAKHEIKRFHLFFGIQFLNFLANTLYTAKITDEATCYKAFRTQVLEETRLECRGFEFCPEITAKVRKKGYKIYEVPISYHPRSTMEGKKLNWRHGVEAIWTLIKYRFVD